MAHSTTFDKDSEIIETVFEGIVWYSELKTAIREITDIAGKENCYLWLNDFKSASPRLTTMEIFELPKLISEAAQLLNIQPGKIHRAIVVPKNNDDFKFAETISSNRIQNMAVFENISNARDWLRQK